MLVQDSDANYSEDEVSVAEGNDEEFVDEVEIAQAGATTADDAMTTQFMDYQESRQEIILRKSDRSIKEIADWFSTGKLNTRPEWQRAYVWNRIRASRLIESLLLDIPIPAIYLAKKPDGYYDVVDGVQRVTTIQRFLNNEFALSEVARLTTLSGKRYNQLPEVIQNKIKENTIQILELSPHVTKKDLVHVFKRLNTGGVPLNDMEVRNCVWRGPMLELVEKLAVRDEFVKTIGVKRKDFSKRMEDKSFVLRFLAFHRFSWTFTGKDGGSIKALIDHFCETYYDAQSYNIREWEQKFITAINGAATVFGEHAFRRRITDKHGNAQWGKQANASVFQVITVTFAKYEQYQLTERADAIYEEFLDMITTDGHWNECITSSTGRPDYFKYAFATWDARLEAIMKDTTVRDSQRAFSRTLKKELFDQDSVCAECGQQIRLIDDAAMDHHEHYWRGGATIPSNARLLHRLCNMRRSK